MEHDPSTCKTCLRNERARFDSATGHHFVPHYGDAAYPLFKLYPVVPETV